MTRASSGLAAISLAVGLFACSDRPTPAHRPVEPRHALPHAPPAQSPRWLVVAPHPDDEVLIASGVLARQAADGIAPYVVVMTNGDADCAHDGLERERESVEGLARLGVWETQVRFLGYPDGALPRLGRTPLDVRRLVRGTGCKAGHTTYGERGEGHADFHRARTGRAAPYTRDAVVEDLARAIEEIDPTDVAITHPEDTHADHAATYAIFRDALDHLPRAPRVHRAIVHNGDCWPNGREDVDPCPRTEIAPGKPTPALTGRLAGYVARERLPVPAPMLVSDTANNPKVQAIAAHRSQTRGTLESYLFGFVRGDEAFFPEILERHGSQWMRVGTTDQEGVRARLARGAGHFELPRADGGKYVVDVDPGLLEARLVRRDLRGDHPLHAWTLPHDLWSSDAEEIFELRADPRQEDHVVELTLRCRGVLVGVAVDVSAFPSARRAP